MIRRHRHLLIIGSVACLITILVLLNQIIWKSYKGQIHNSLNLHEKWSLRTNAPVLSIDYSRDMEYMAYATDNIAEILKHADKKSIKTLPLMPYRSQSVAFSLTGKFLAVLGRQIAPSLWDTKAWKEFVLSVPTDSGTVDDYLADSPPNVAFSFDDKYMATAHNRRKTFGVFIGEIWIWNLDTGSVDHMLKMNTEMVTSIAFSHDGKYLASGDNQGHIKLWDTSAWKCVFELPSRANVSELSFSPKSNLIAYGGNWSSEEDLISVLSIGSEANKKIVLAGSPGDSNSVLSIKFAPNGDYLVAREFTKESKYRLQIWEVPSGRSLGIFQSDRQVNSIAISPDGTELAAGCGNPYTGKDCGVLIWEMPHSRKQ